VGREVMASERTHTSLCPTCGKVLRYCDAAEFEHFPFCSERCRMVDLGRWFGGEYRIPAEKSPHQDDKKNS
ncbi:unnamed protein product, partial [marine sediment metagenome]